MIHRYMLGVLDQDIGNSRGSVANKVHSLGKGSLPRLLGIIVRGY